MFGLCLTLWLIILKVLIGGGLNHRMGLFDMVMIKDNHISIAGGVTNALKSVDLYLEQNNLQMGVEVMPIALKLFFDKVISSLCVFRACWWVSWRVRVPF